MAGRTEGMVPLTAMSQDGAEVGPSAKSALDTENLIIIENTDMAIYEAVLEGEIVGGVIYSEAADGVTLLATSIFPAFRGKGIAPSLLRGVLEKLRAKGGSITVTCPFAAEFVGDHPEYADVVRAVLPSNDRNFRRADW